MEPVMEYTLPGMDSLRVLRDFYSLKVNFLRENYQ